LFGSGLGNRPSGAGQTNGRTVVEPVPGLAVVVVAAVVVDGVVVDAVVVDETTVVGLVVDGVGVVVGVVDVVLEVTVLLPGVVVIFLQEAMSGLTQFNVFGSKMDVPGQEAG